MPRMVASVSAISLPKDLTKRKLKVGVAIDGSKVSEKALSLGGRLLHPDRLDKIYILHVSDPNKPWLPDTLTPEHLEHEYQLKCHDQKVNFFVSTQETAQAHFAQNSLFACSLMLYGTRRRKLKGKAPVLL